MIVLEPGQYNKHAVESSLRDWLFRQHQALADVESKIRDAETLIRYEVEQEVEHQALQNALSEIELFTKNAAMRQRFFDVIEVSANRTAEAAEVIENETGIAGFHCIEAVNVILGTIDVVPWMRTRVLAALKQAKIRVRGLLSNGA